MSEPTTITGNFADIQPGQTLQLTGFLARTSAGNGAQFQVTIYKKPSQPHLNRNGKVLG
ncbi:hypothetical protein [Tolypothrix bouteillei]